MRALASCLILNATFPLDAMAQTAPAAVAQPAAAQQFNAEQLDALLASIALYPDESLTEVLMASTSRSKWWQLRAGWKTPHTSRCLATRWQSPGSRTVGSQREVAGADPCRIGNLEQQSDLAAATRICVREPAGRRIRCRAATAPTGTAEQQVGSRSPQQTVSTQQVTTSRRRVVARRQRSSRLSSSSRRKPTRSTCPLTIRPWCTVRLGHTRPIRRTMRLRPPATILVQHWPLDLPSRLGPRSSVAFGAGHGLDGAAVTPTSTSIGTTTST